MEKKEDRININDEGLIFKIMILFSLVLVITFFVIAVGPQFGIDVHKIFK